MQVSVWTQVGSNRTGRRNVKFHSNYYENRTFWGRDHGSTLGSKGVHPVVDSTRKSILVMHRSQLGPMSGPTVPYVYIYVRYRWTRLT